MGKLVMLFEWFSQSDVMWLLKSLSCLLPGVINRCLCVYR